MSNNEIAVLNETQEKSLITAVDKCHLISEMKNNTLKSLRLAQGQAELNKVLNVPEIANMIMFFQNSPLGFLTDKKDTGGYSQEIVILAAQEALTSGAYLHGNEFNIIASRCYFAQSFFVRKVREYCSKHLIKRNFEYSCKYVEPSGKQKKFKVTVKITWSFPNKDEMTQMEAYNLVGVSEDQVNGKAKKRAHQWLYNELTDNNYLLAPDEDDTFDMKEEKPDTEIAKTPGATKATVIKALDDAADLQDLDARYKRACESHGFVDDNDVHAAYNEKKETLK